MARDPKGTLMRRSGVAIVLIANHLDWKPATVYQVGVGQYHQEVDVMREVWETCRFVGYEAHPGIYKEIKDYPGALHNIAISDYIGKGKLQIKARHKDGSSLYGHTKHEERDSYQIIEVPVKTLDSIYSVLPPEESLLWLDCEGGEAAALRGGLRFLQSITAVNVEMTSKPLGPDWCTPSEVHEILQSSGFFQQWIHTQRSSAGQYDAIYVRKDLFNPEYCCNVSEVNRWTGNV